MLARLRPFVSTPMKIAPHAVPPIVPRPPASDVPPTTTAAITSSSYCNPEFGTPAPSREANVNPATPARTPFNAYTIQITRCVLTPANHDASAFPPVAYTRRPNTVRFSTNAPIVVTIPNTYTGAGIPNGTALPNAPNDAGKLPMLRPLETMNAIPLAMVSIASVATN